MKRTTIAFAIGEAWGLISMSGSRLFDINTNNNENLSLEETHQITEITNDLAKVRDKLTEFIARMEK